MSSQPTVLVVEDEILIRLHVSDFLRDCGYNVLEATDGSQALGMLQADAPVDIVFTDVTLPGETDGFALAQWIRERKPTLPVVLTSGKATRDALEIGGLKFFPKPCDYSEVERYIRTLLSGGLQS